MSVQQRDPAAEEHWTLLSLNDEPERRQFLLSPHQVIGQFSIDVVDRTNLHLAKVVRPYGMIVGIRDEARTPEPEFSTNSLSAHIILTFFSTNSGFADAAFGLYPIPMARASYAETENAPAKRCLVLSYLRNELSSKVEARSAKV